MTIMHFSFGFYPSLRLHPPLRDRILEFSMDYDVAPVTPKAHTTNLYTYSHWNVFRLFDLLNTLTCRAIHSVTKQTTQAIPDFQLRHKKKLSSHREKLFAFCLSPPIASQALVYHTQTTRITLFPPLVWARLLYATIKTHRQGFPMMCIYLLIPLLLPG